MPPEVILRKSELALNEYQPDPSTPLAPFDMLITNGNTYRVLTAS